MPRISATEAGSQNICAFLDMLCISEGTHGKGDDGYNVLVGGQLFHSYVEHPNILVHLRPGLSSTAAGRYQLLSRYFVPYANMLRLPDFSPLSQDKIAIQQIRERKALLSIEAGYFDDAVDRVRNIWASLPGAGYGQHENKLEALRDAYIGFGGKVENP